MIKKAKIIVDYEVLAEHMQAMLLAAQQADWDKVTDLEVYYKAKIAQIQASKSQVELTKIEQARKIELIKQILHDDHEIQSLIYPRMDELTKLIYGNQNSMKLNRTYGV
jgi:flagellar protein FliT